jgi:lipopolysaccharide/colanic/teichoic acid biosynthesis glycosyltransferase
MRLLAVISLILLSPVIIGIGVVIFLSSGRGMVFKQQRVGLNRKPFTIYKFRTMDEGTVTFVGKFIRKIGLDEIPQLINIIRNEMSFVGPRPLTKADIIRLGWKGTAYDLRWSVKPGITGMGQLTSVCDANVTMGNDLFYAKNKSIRLDLSVMRRTLLVPLIGKRTK